MSDHDAPPDAGPGLFMTCPDCGLLEAPRRSPPLDPAEGRLIGRVTICLGCGSLAFKTEGGRLRVPTAVEDMLLRLDPEWEALARVSSALARGAAPDARP